MQTQIFHPLCLRLKLKMFVFLLEAWFKLWKQILSLVL